MIQNYRQHVYRYIQQQMLDGELQPLDHLSYRAVAKDLGISATPVREAFGQLVSDGYLVYEAKVGNRVRSFTRKEIEDLYDLRELLEGHAAQVAATKVTDADLAELDRLCELTHAMCHEARDKGLTELKGEFARRWAAVDVQFHMRIIDAADNSALSEAARSNRVLSILCGQGFRLPQDRFLYNRARTWSEHMRILQALKQRDAHAAKMYTVVSNRRAKHVSLTAFDHHQASVIEPAEQMAFDDVEKVFGKRRY